MTSDTLIASLALLIPILSVTVSLGALIIWIVVWHRRRVHEGDCRHKERMAAIEKGLDLPPESLPQPAQMPPRARYLLRGLIWLGVGIALTFGVGGTFGAHMGEFGWIAVAVGAAYLIFYFVEGRKPAVSERDPPSSGNDRSP
jgi:Domain of unknown function (DUF6249)